MLLLIVTVSLVVSFFLFPISTIEWIGEKAKARASAWVALFTKEKKEDNSNG